MTAAGTLAEAMHSAGSAKQNEAAKLEKLKAFTHKKAAGYERCSKGQFYVGYGAIRLGCTVFLCFTPLSQDCCEFLP